MPNLDPYALVRRSAVLALLIVAAEAAVATSIALVPALQPAGTSIWAALVAPSLCVLTGLALLGLGPRRPALIGLAALATALGLGAAAAGLAAVSPSLRGIGLAFAAPLVVGEVLAAGGWIAHRGERTAAALSLVGAALTTCAAAFLVERADVDVTAAALAVGGLCAQLQLAVARAGEPSAQGGTDAAQGGDVVSAAGARLGAVARGVLLAALGRSGPQGDA